MRDLFEPVAEAADHRLRLDRIENATIRGDQALLVQLFSNLIENAILHTPAGTEIVLALSHQAGQAVVTVSDDGPGVPREEHAKLFQRLYRREASRSQPGYGLGLAMVAAIAELHGASVTVDAARVPGLSVVIAFAPAS
jgi:signal transduction histidine kinase